MTLTTHGERGTRTYNRQSPQWDAGAVMGLKAKPPGAERLFALSQPEESANLSLNLFLRDRNCVADGSAS